MTPITHPQRILIDAAIRLVLIAVVLAGAAWFGFWLAYWFKVSGLLP